MFAGRVGHIGVFGLTVALLALVAAAITEVTPYFPVIMSVAVASCVGLIHWLFPRSRLLSISLANLLAVYACVFAFFIGSIFSQVSKVAIDIGFLLPILAFMIGAVSKRATIRRFISSGNFSRIRHPDRGFVWLVPVFAVGAVSWILPALPFAREHNDLVFLVAMAMIAGVVLIVSDEVATFLVETGLLFEEFFERSARLVIPAFAFLTFYSLNVVVFACLYRLIDQYAPGHHFTIMGEARPLTFAEALYFSLVTVATVGFGDIIPRTDLMRLITGVQVVAGVLLLLFGVSEILNYTREHRHDRHRPPNPD